MSESDPMQGHGHGEGHGAERKGATVEIFDHEIDLKGIVNVGVWLAVVTIASFAVVWFFYRGLSSFERKALDRKPSPVREATAPRMPLGPQLQAVPEKELAAFRKAEQERLNGWGWVERERGIAHVPLAKAIDEVAAKGLPNFSQPAAPPAGEAAP